MIKLYITTEMDTKCEYDEKLSMELSLKFDTSKHKDWSEEIQQHLTDYLCVEPYDPRAEPQVYYAAPYC